MHYLWALIICFFLHFSCEDDFRKKRMNNLLDLPWVAVDPLVIALPLSAAVMCVLQIHFQWDENSSAANPA
jgi:hypothetical protein